MVLPEMALVEQIFDPQKIDDIPAEVARETETLSLANKLKRGHTVAITAGSRGIRNIDVITKSVVRQIKELGGNPFIIPAMEAMAALRQRDRSRFSKNTEFRNRQWGVLSGVQWRLSVLGMLEMDIQSLWTDMPWRLTILSL